VFEFLVDELGNDAYDGSVRNPKKRTVTMFHGSTDSLSMKHTLQEITKDDGVIRCVVATVAFGLGVSIRNIRNVYVWGVPGTIQSLWQMIGRAARDGAKGDAYIYATKTSMSIKPTPDDEMKDLIGKLNDETGCVRCVRQGILAQLQTTGMNTSRLDQLRDRKECGLQCLNCVCQYCVCCSLCKRQCKCRSAEAVLVNMS
jgi:superfamily II DNA helicase RecQ